MFDEWAKNIQNTNTAGLTTQAPMWNNFSAALYDDRKGQETVGLAKIDDINQQAQKDYDEKMAAAARAEAQAQAQAKIDELNPKNFRMEPADDGGYNFYDGKGDKISVYDYARATGARPEELLKDSNNPNDQKFVRDHAVVQSLVNAMVNQDTQAIGVLRSQYMYTDDQGNKVDPIGTMLDQYRNKTPQDMIKDFRNHWGSMYGGKSSTNQNGQTDRVLGEPRRAANQLTDDEAAAIGNSSYDQLTASLNQGAKEPSWWEGLLRNGSNAAPYLMTANPVTAVPGIINQIQGNPMFKGSSEYLNNRNNIWNDEKKRRESNPWLQTVYGGK